MTHIRVRATVAIFGLSRGDEVVVELTPSVDAAIDHGFLIWLDAPDPAYVEPEVTEVVKKRATKKKAEDEREGEADAGAATVISFEPARLFEEAPVVVDFDPEDRAES